MLSMHSVTQKDIIAALKAFVVDARSSPHSIYTDFDSKLLDGETGIWFRQNKCKLCASPTGHQHQMGYLNVHHGR